jgi:predicted TIM-barrel fold metal-dependent hydrolase
VFERHNDWVLDYCSVAPERLIGIGCLGLPDIDVALAEMERASGRGVRGFAIPAHVDPDRPYSHADYDRFWAAAQDAGVPLTMHIFTGASLDGGLPAHWGAPAATIKGYTLAQATVINTMIDLICGGVCERFPGLQFVISEFETGWVAQCLQRLDHATYRSPQYAVDYLTMKPSEYFRRQFHVTFEDDEAGVLTRHLIGVNCMLWGNDYPHHDAIWPHSMQVLDETLAGVPDDERERMCFTSTVELYGIDVAALP